MVELIDIELAKILVTRLERLSADSYWAHRASGIRGALLRYVEYFDSEIDINSEIPQSHLLQSLINNGYDLLEKAAREIPDYK